MSTSPARFLFRFLFISIIVWIVYIFVTRLVAWYVSRKIKASVEFRFGGWKCLRDVFVKFEKGAIESVSVSEIRLSLRQSLVRLGIGFFSKDPKLQILISDLEIVTRPSQKTAKKTRSGKLRNSGRGKWMIVATVARFLSVSVTELVVKIPTTNVEIKELKLDITKDGGSQVILFVHLRLLLMAVHICDPQISCDQSSSYNDEISNSMGDASFSMPERFSDSFSCEELSLSSEFGHDRGVGVVIKNFDITSGVVAMNLSERLFLKSKHSTDTFSNSNQIMDSATGSVTADNLQKKQTLASVTKYISLFPEKVSFNLPQLDASCVHRGHNLFAQNNIMGIKMKSTKFQSNDDAGESTRLDVQLEFSEMHIFREAKTSILEILKADVVSSVYVPTQSSTSIRAEVDVKLGGTQCNIIVNKLKPWIQLLGSKKKGMSLREESSSIKKKSSSEIKVIMWTCTVSAPEMTIVLYSISSFPLYHVCSQSSHLFANNISNLGSSMHMELGELNLHMADEYTDGLNECLFGVETNLNSLMHISKIIIDWGKKDTESSEENCSKYEVVLFVDVTGIGIHFSLKRLESLISTAISFESLVKKLFPGSKTIQNRGGRSSKPSGKGAQILKFNLERCFVNFSSDIGLENTVIEDPKRVNYGSQGGRIIISTLADGTQRSASIMSTISNECKKLKYSVSLDIFHFNLCINKEKKSTQMELERARSIFQEYPEGEQLGAKVVLFDMQNAKFVRRSGGLKDISVCSYFSATDITVRWEPDLHLSLLELMLHSKLLVHNQKLKDIENKHMAETMGRNVDAAVESGQYDKTHKKKDSVCAIDVESLNISAEAGDGVDLLVQIQSIFSENARIGVLLEGLILSFNGSRVFKSSRMQISRIPSSNISTEAKHLASTTWDWVIQGLDVHICMPFRLQLRAIEDAIEDMMRGLKLITDAKTKLIYPIKKESTTPKKTSSVKFGSVKLCIRKITADIEEEPIQGWLDEHYHLMKNEACELAVRLESLEDLISKSNQCSGSSENDCTPDRKFFCNGIKVDIHDPSVIREKQEEIYKQSFKSYYKTCQKLVLSEGSGACKQGFQAGFKPSTSRKSLFSLSATDLDLSLTRIDGGDDGMIEVLRKLDPVCQENNIPFSRLLGSNISLRTSSLAVHLRNYTFPLFSATFGKCEGCVVLAQQATCFQPQIQQDVFIGKWRKVRMFRSASGTTPPMKTYMDLPIYFQKADVSFGVGYEPVFADVSYAFTVALRRADLSVRNAISNDTLDISITKLPQKERSLPWWDEVRNYIHGHATLFFSETKWNVLATADPYEKHDKLEVISNYMKIQQSDGRVYLCAKDIKISVSSVESLVKNRSLKLLPQITCPFIEAPAFSLEVTMDWECESGYPLNHYLYALPIERESRKIVFDPFRSTSLSLRWNFLLRPSLLSCDGHFSSSTMGNTSIPDTTINHPPDVGISSPTVNVGAHDLAWVFKFWNMNFLPPHKLRAFSRWPRFGIPRVQRSGNLSLDRVMTEFMLRIDATPACIKHVPLLDDDPAKGLTFKITKLKHEMGFSRGKQKFTFECQRDPLDLVYQGIDLHVPKAYLDREDCNSVVKAVQLTSKSSQIAPIDKVSNEKSDHMTDCSEKHRDDGFLLSSDYFTIRRQAPKADPARLLAWQEAGRKNLETTYVRSEFENRSESDEYMRSDPSDDDDDGYNVLIADNCQRVFVYGLKLLWTIENRDAVWSFVGGISKAFEPPKPSPSRQYTQRKLVEKIQDPKDVELVQDGISNPPSSNPSESLPSPRHDKFSESISSPSHSVKIENSSPLSVEKNGQVIDPEEGTRHFMVNVIEPQFNLHSEEANGRFLLAAVSGRVLARSFHSVLHVGHEMMEQLGTGNINIPECEPEMAWNRMELSVMLEHVQAHVAPTDVDPGAGLQWLPKIRKSSPKVKRTGALLERVFMPCDMYFRYTRHKGGTPDLKVKPLKELIFNSHDISATMTSRQFQVMIDVLSNLLFARLPKLRSVLTICFISKCRICSWPRKSSISYLSEDDEDVEEEADEMVPEGVEEVERARVNLEQRERELKLIRDDIRKLSIDNDTNPELYLEKEDLWMISGGKSTLVQGLKKELASLQTNRKVASASLRVALQKAVQLRLMEKDKNKSLSYAMRISLQIKKVVWEMLVDGKPFAEAEINDMIYDFERDYKDVGAARFTTKFFVVRFGLPNAKYDMLLAPWNPPPEWGKKVMLKVHAKQGAPKDGNSSLELFQIDIYPLKIYLTETMYRMMWVYFFPEEDQDSQRRQEVWKVSTTAGSKRIKKGSSMHESFASSSHPSKECEILSKSNASISVSSQSLLNADSSQALKLQSLKANIVSGSAPELRRTFSFDRTWEENVAENVANELVLQAQSKSGGLVSTEQHDESSKNKSKDPKVIKSGRSSHEEKKTAKPNDEKRPRPRKMMEFHNIKISQVELKVTYEGSRFPVNDMRLLMDTFHRVEFTGTWKRLFSRVKKHIIWGVLKSVTGMQGKKFKDKAIGPIIREREVNDSDSDGGETENPDQHPITWVKRPSDGAGDGFVTSIRGLFSSQRRKAKAFVLRTMRGEAESEYHGDWSESEAEFSPFARQLTITKAKKLIRRHTKKFRSRGQKGHSRDSHPSSPRETTTMVSDSSGESSPYEDFHE